MKKQPEGLVELKRFCHQSNPMIIFFDLVSSMLIVLKNPDIIYEKIYSKVNVLQRDLQKIVEFAMSKIFNSRFEFSLSYITLKSK